MAELAAMYQRIPDALVRQVSQKQPLSFAILKLPPDPADASPRAKAKKRPGTLEEATRRGRTPRPMDTSLGRWEPRTFPKGMGLEGALARVEAANALEPYAAKLRLHFADGSHLLLTRTDWTDPSTLQCTGLYNPHGAFDEHTQPRKNLFAATEGRRRHTSLVNPRGHLLDRPRTEDGEPLRSTFKDPPPQTGKAGFTFTPLSSHAFGVRPNLSFAGVRPGLRETNKTAYHYLRKGPLPSLSGSAAAPGTHRTPSASAAAPAPPADTIALPPL